MRHEGRTGELLSIVRFAPSRASRPIRIYLAHPENTADGKDYLPSDADVRKMRPPQ